jgi:asparagine synthase (glutamine-hydrolysing)
MGRRLSHRGWHVAWAAIDRDIYMGVASNRPDTRPASVILDHSRAHAMHGSTQDAAEMYRDGGVSAFDRAGVPFALAAWDETAQQLVLARDFMGLKPLYYTLLDGQGVAFASEYKALLAIHRVPATADLEALQYLQSAKSSPNDGRTLLRGIRSVPPGRIARFTRAGEQHNESLSPTIALNVQAPNETSAADRLIRLLSDAVSPLVKNRSQIGIALSGGIDSLAVAHLVRNCNPDTRIVGFTTGQSLDDRDMRVAALAMERLNGEHVPITIDPQVLITRLPEAVWHLENPIGRSETVHFLELGRIAREHGFDWLFSGMGADGIFAGMPRHKVLWLAGHVRPLRADLMEFFSATQTGRAPTRPLARMLAYLYFKGDVPLVPAVLEARDEPLAHSSVTPGPEFLNRALLDAEPEHTAYSLPRIERTLQASAVDYVSPFLNRAVIDFAFTLPGHMKIRHGRDKYILREAMRRLISEDLRKVPKGLMRFNQGDRFTETLQVLADRYLSTERIQRRGFFDVHQVGEIRKRTVQRASHPEALMRLWTLIVTEIWAEQYLDHRGRRPENYSLDPSNSQISAPPVREARSSHRPATVAIALKPSGAMSP